jgi:hypothetical protein
MLKRILFSPFLRRMSVKVLLLTLSIIHCQLSISLAQDVRASAKSDASIIKIGEQTKLHLIVQAPPDAKIKFPVIPDTITKIEIVNRAKIDTVKSADGKQISYEQIITITAFDSGYYAIPPFVFPYTRNGKPEVDSTMTEAMLFTVHTVPVDTTQAIKEIKQPLDIPFSFREALPYILAGLGVILLIFMVFYLLRKSKKKGPEAKVFVPKRPAHEVALEELRKLEAEKLWQSGYYKKYHSALSDIVRTYIEHRFGMMAMEQTTDEILVGFKGKMLDVLLKEKLQYILQTADFVKFAKAEPIASENELCLRNAYEFVEMTRQQVMQAEEKKEETV